MLKRILLALGLRKAPVPVQRYFYASSFVGGLPALAYVAFKHRGNIAQMFRKLRSRSAAPQMASGAV